MIQESFNRKRGRDFVLLKVERKKTDVSLVAMIKCDATVRRIFSGGRREKKQSESGEFHRRNSDQTS